MKGRYFIAAALFPLTLSLIVAGSGKGGASMENSQIMVGDNDSAAVGEPIQTKLFYDYPLNTMRTTQLCESTATHARRHCITASVTHYAAARDTTHRRYPYHITATEENSMVQLGSIEQLDRGIFFNVENGEISHIGFSNGSNRLLTIIKPPVQGGNPLLYVALLNALIKYHGAMRDGKLDGKYVREPQFEFETTIAYLKSVKKRVKPAWVIDAIAGKCLDSFVCWITLRPDGKKRGVYGY